MRGRWLKRSAAMLLCAGLLLAPGGVKTIRAENPISDSRAITAYSESFTMGTVSALKNGVTFQNAVYASNNDTIAVSASPNTGYSFSHFTDNGVIVTKSSYYTFNPGYYDHNVVAHFVERSDRKKEKDDDTRKNVNWGNSACVYAPGYAITATSITTSQVGQGKECVAAFDSVKGNYQYIGMYNISFAHAGKPIEKLDHKVQLLFDIPAEYQKTGREFAMLRVYKGQPAFLEDLGNRGNKVQFETDCTAAYALVYRDGGGIAVDPDTALQALEAQQLQQQALLAGQQQAAADAAYKQAQLQQLLAMQQALAAQQAQIDQMLADLQGR